MIDVNLQSWVWAPSFKIFKDIWKAIEHKIVLSHEQMHE